MASGGQDAYVGGLFQERSHQAYALAPDGIEVVQHQQHPPGPQARRDVSHSDGDPATHGVHARPHLPVQRLGHGLRDPPSARRSAVPPPHPHDAVRQRTSHRGGRVLGEEALADTRAADHRDEPALGEEPTKRRQLLGPSDQSAPAGPARPRTTRTWIARPPAEPLRLGRVLPVAPCSHASPFLSACPPRVAIAVRNDCAESSLHRFRQNV
ncbi:hypothetical protein [Streptomyces sp. NPDC018584]|uniref:hypothetical protein n=1 Tax=unclassified Streptomyces TaxID=2593676 RepID=UPI0037A5C5D8